MDYIEYSNFSCEVWNRFLVDLSLVTKRVVKRVPFYPNCKRNMRLFFPD